GLHNFIVREMTAGEAVAPNCPGGERERLPGMSDVVQAVSICPVTVLPSLAPRDAGQDKYYGRGLIRPLHLEIAASSLLGHVRRGPVMIQAIGPLLQVACEEVELGGVQIPGGWIDAQRIPVSGGWNALGRANRSGIEEQLRKERRAVSGRCGAGNGMKDLERGRFREGWIRREVEHGHVLVMTKWIGHVRPVEKMQCSRQGRDAVFRKLVIFPPRHRRSMDVNDTRGRPGVAATVLVQRIIFRLSQA